MAEHAGYTVGIDIGGTFTDFVLLSPDGLPAGVHKCLTTPHDPSEACLVGLRALLDGAGIEVGQVGRVVHGTTLAVNAITERKGARTALLTTRGFRDVLELRTEQRYDAYDLGLAFPEPLVPRRWRRDVSERTLRDGTLQIALDRDEVARILRDLGGERVQAIAVSFLHAYVNPANEQAARAVIEATLPDVHVSISSEVAPEIREFQRTSTVVANAYVQPLVERYMERLHEGLRSVGCRAPLHLMLSSGGTALPETAVRFPIRLLESGPAAGAAAAAFLARAAGLPAVIGFDMGGTTAKISVVDNGEPAYTGELETARVHRFKRGSGLPVRLPSVDLLEIGAGGGSIAHIDRLGLLKVGPQSAGADPAPACYGMGGEEPTVTDADLLLGYLDPGFFLGGTMPLHRELAEGAISARLSRRLGLGVTDAAMGIHRVVNENMAAAVRMHCAEKGRDRRRYTLMAFGGAAPVHACRVARELQIERVIVPPMAGALSALGLLVAPVSFEFTRSYVDTLDAVDWSVLTDILSEMEHEGMRLLTEAGVEPAQATILRWADMRYAGQAHEIRVPVPGGTLGPQTRQVIMQAFQEVYERLYTRRGPEHPVEVLVWRVVVSGPPFHMQMAASGPASRQRPSRKGTRRAYFPEAGGFVECPVYDRYALQAGDVLAGPALVEERESTVVVGPGDAARVDAGLNLVISVEEV